MIWQLEANKSRTRQHATGPQQSIAGWYLLRGYENVHATFAIRHGHTCGIRTATYVHIYTAKKICCTHINTCLNQFKKPLGSTSFSHIFYLSTCIPLWQQPAVLLTLASTRCAHFSGIWQSIEMLLCKLFQQISTQSWIKWIHLFSNLVRKHNRRLAIHMPKEFSNLSFLEFMNSPLIVVSRIVYFLVTVLLGRMIYCEISSLQYLWQTKLS